MKNLYIIFFLLVFFSGCVQHSPKITINAPAFGGDTCLFYYSSLCDTLFLDSKGQGQLEIKPLMLFGTLNLKGNGLQFQFYTGMKDLDIHIDENKKVRFEGEHAAASNFHMQTKYPYLNWYLVKDAGKEELDKYLQQHADTLNQILQSGQLNDPEFIRFQQEEFKYSIESFRHTLLLSSGNITGEEIESYQKSLVENEELLPLKSYIYALYRFPKDLILYEKRNSVRLPFQEMREVLDYYMAHYKNPKIREMVIYQLAIDYILNSESGNDPYLDKIYRANVTDASLINAYENASRTWQYLWNEKPCDAIPATNMTGEKLDFNAYKGKYVLVDIWATWCKPCTREQGIMFEIEPEFEGKNIEFITLSCDRYRKVWEKYCKDHHMDAKHHYNTQDMGALFKQYAVRVIPRFLLLDPDGNLLSANFFKPSSKEFKETLTYLLEK